MLMNNKMKKLYGDRAFSILSSDLSELISEGIIFDQDYFLFKSFHNANEIIDKNWVKQIYMDETGFECSVNSFHIGDYYSCEFVSLQEIANISFEFIRKFRQYWECKVKESCVIILTIPLDTEFNSDAIFRFHKKRENQYWVNPEDIDKSSEAVMILEICEY